MRFWIGGPRIAGFRTGVSFGPRDFRRPSSPTPVLRQGAVTEPATPGLIYVIAGGPSLVKIGVSDDPLARLASLQTASPSRLDIVYAAAVAGGDARPLEQAVHAVLGDYRQTGEWFSIPPVMAVGTIASAAFQVGHQVVEIKKEHLRYAVDRAKSEAVATKKAPRMSRDRKATIYALLMTSPVTALLIYSAVQDATKDPYVAIAIGVMTMVSYIAFYVVFRIMLMFSGA